MSLMGSLDASAEGADVVSIHSESSLVVIDLHPAKRRHGAETLEMTSSGGERSNDDSGYVRSPDLQPELLVDENHNGHSKNRPLSGQSAGSGKEVTDREPWNANKAFKKHVSSEGSGLDEPNIAAFENPVFNYSVPEDQNNNTMDTLEPSENKELPRDTGVIQNGEEDCAKDTNVNIPKKSLEYPASTESDTNSLEQQAEESQILTPDMSDTQFENPEMSPDGDGKPATEDQKPPNSAAVNANGMHTATENSDQFQESKPTPGQGADRYPANAAHTQAVSEEAEDIKPQSSPDRQDTTNEVPLPDPNSKVVVHFPVDDTRSSVQASLTPQLQAEVTSPVADDSGGGGAGGDTLILSSGEQGESSTDVKAAAAADENSNSNTYNDNALSAGTFANPPERTTSEKGAESSPPVVKQEVKKSVSFGGPGLTHAIFDPKMTKSYINEGLDLEAEDVQKKPGLDRGLSVASSVDSASSDYRNPESWQALAPPSNTSTPLKSQPIPEDTLDEVQLDIPSSPAMRGVGAQFNDSGELLVGDMSSSSSSAFNDGARGVQGGAGVVALRDKDEEQIKDEEQWLEWAKKQFKDQKEKQMSFKEFQRALKIRQTFFAERFFEQFDKDGNGKVDPDEIVDTLGQFHHGETKDRFRFLFDIYDINGDGAIDPEELKTVLRACTQESNMKLSEESIEQLALAIFEEGDIDNNGEISFDELMAVLNKYPEVINNLCISPNEVLRQQRDTGHSTSPKSSSSCCTTKYVQNNISSLVCIILYIIINVGLFATCVRYSAFNWLVIIARGCGMCLNFNCSLILVFVLRHTLSWLRSTKVGNHLPLDSNLAFHKAVGMAILVLSIVHTAAHLGNIGYVRATPLPGNGTHIEFWEYLFTLKSGVGFVGPGFAYLSGVIILLILIIMCICAMPCIRRKRFFEVFYWTHLLYIFFFIVLIMHGPIFYIFLIIPGTVFIIEKIGITLIMRKAKYGQIYIERVNLLPSKVTNLIIRRPPNFAYYPGDWIFIRVPAIAGFEWHPFTISSAPENQEELWLHIRSAGHWTNRLYEYFDSYETVEIMKDAGRGGRDVENVQVIKPNSMKINKQVPLKKRVGTAPAKAIELTAHRAKVSKSTSHTFKHSTSVNERKSRLPEVALDLIEMWKKRHNTKHVRVPCSIDGPYGTPTREIFDTEHAVLIGAGIGVTPFASILQSIMHRYKALKRTCPNCHHKWYGELPATVMKLKKVHFIWINRDQRCFEWFVNMITQIEVEAQSTEDGKFDKFLEMEMYMTTAVSSNDIKGVGLQLALELIHKKCDRDLLTGLRTRTKPGRPEWNKVFSKIRDEKKGKVKVFFCGAPALAKVLQGHCNSFGYDFAKENF